MTHPNQEAAEAPDSIDRAIALEATFVDQEFLHSETTKGYCFRACIATILRMPIKAVPHFAALDYAPDVFVAMECAMAWLESRGYEMWMDLDDGENPLPLCIVTGFSTRGVAHACVGVTATGAIIHDPHPSRAGLSSVDKRLYLFQKAALASTPSPAVSAEPVEDERAGDEWLDEAYDRLCRSCKGAGEVPPTLPTFVRGLIGMLAPVMGATHPKAEPAGVPEGWQLVPKEPTPEMVKAGASCASSNMVWREMLSAAPAPQYKEGA